MKKIVFILALLAPLIMLSQKNKSKVHTINMDYKKWNSLEKELPKRMGVGDIIQIICSNVPDSLKMVTKLSYDNKFFEDGSLFSTWTKFNDHPAKPEDMKINLDAEAPKDPDENKPKDEKIVHLDSKGNVDFLSEDSQYQKNIDDPTKINIGNVVKALEIGDAINFVNPLAQKEKKIDGPAHKAKKDIEVQQVFVTYFQKNIVKKIQYYQDYITFLKKQRDDLAAQVSAQAEDKTHIEQIHFRVDNYDNISFQTIMMNNSNEIAKRSSPFTFKNWNAVKIDFSTGLTFNNLIDESYEIVKMDKPMVKDSDGNNIAKDTVQVLEKKGSRLNTGPVVLAHTYLRLGTEITPAISAGIGYNLLNSNLNYLLGISCLFGQEQRFIMTFGCILGKVKTLPKYYNIETDYDREAFEKIYSANLSMHDSWDIKGSLSLTYNLNLKNRNGKEFELK